MTAPTLDFDMYVADTEDLDIAVVDSNSAVFNITGCTVRWRLSKWNADQTKFNATPLLIKAIGTGITVTNAVLGLLTVAIASTDTVNLKPDLYYHELEIVDTLGRVQTALNGTITLLPALITNP